MHRFFVKPHQIEADSITIDGEDFKHITKVLRLKDQEEIEICDGADKDYIAVVDQVEKDYLVAKILRTHNAFGENQKIKVTLFQGVPKGTKMETVIQKCVETGVVEITPFTSKRTVVNLKEKADKKLARWQRIAYEAAKQSKRGMVPVVSEMMTLAEVADALDNYDLVILAYEDAREQSLKDVLSSLEYDPQTIAVIVGPEGGFAPEEAAMIEEAGGYAVTLGHRILRTETAGMVVLSQLNFFYED
ncbi:MAG: 16S rRNA (uracil(1498)-N(3))-methyltransferase [Eubacterium sp.]|nr:16S rRNA (uracil(1498)-N(3))-methyltransferase [Eubacterium sp.]